MERKTPSGLRHSCLSVAVASSITCLQVQATTNHSAHHEGGGGIELRIWNMEQTLVTSANLSNRWQEGNIEPGTLIESERTAKQFGVAITLFICKRIFKKYGAKKQCLRLTH